MSEKEELQRVIRNLIGALYTRTFGAYGADAYEGQFEQEIQELSEVIIKIVTEVTLSTPPQPAPMDETAKE